MEIKMLNYKKTEKEKIGQNRVSSSSRACLRLSVQEIVTNHQLLHYSLPEELISGSKEAAELGLAYSNNGD